MRGVDYSSNSESAHLGDGCEKDDWSLDFGNGCKEDDASIGNSLPFISVYPTFFFFLFRKD